MRVLLITSSARGHAIAAALARSRHQPQIIHVAQQRNPGISHLGAEEHLVSSLTNLEEMAAIAERSSPDFAVIGPEDPIAAGTADLLENMGIPTIAPRQALARLESSKGFARHLLQKHRINVSPRFRVFGKGEEKKMNNFIDQECPAGFVVKYDGLKGGKGVKVQGEHFHTMQEGIDYALQCIKECGQVVLEERLEGLEFSLLSFVSGTSVIDMPVVQDHKRAYDGELGPNTGGMGTYTDTNHSLPFLTPADLACASTINHRTVEAIHRECSLPYHGILYGGYIVTRTGVKLIEFNVRFGDPEALNLLSILSSDFVDICQAIITGELTQEMVRFDRKATVCKYIVPEGYPENRDQKGERISLPPLAFSHPLPFKGEGTGEGSPKNFRIYFGDVSEDPDGTLRLGSSRAVGIVGIGNTIEEAEHIAQHLSEQVKGPVRFRADIGTSASLQKRIALTQRLCSPSCMSFMPM